MNKLEIKEIEWQKVKFPLYIVGSLWVSFILNKLLFFVEFNRFGLIPRSAWGLVGIFTQPFLHGNWKHLTANSVPLLFLLYFLIILFPKKYIEILIALTVSSGGLLWILGRRAIHIGASGLIYAIATFIVSYAVFKRDKKAIIMSLVVLFLYSGLVWGVLPIINGPSVSWDGHLMGAVAGIALGKYNSRETNSFK